MNVLNRRHCLLTSVGALLLCNIFLFIQGLSAQPLAQYKTKFVGNIIRDGNNIRTSNFLKYWDQVTAENAGKWGSVQNSQGAYNWTQLDKIYNFAKSNSFPYKHHTLVWGQQQPGFMTGLDSAAQFQEIAKWIDTLGKRYPNADFVDVVNEPLHAKPSYRNALGGDGATGWDWVVKTFELARKAWPNAKLHINEYSVINDGNANTQYLQIINILKSKGLVDGIGVQGHHFEVEGPPTTTLNTNLNNLAATGLPIYISELDINQQDDNTQKQRYQTIFPVLYEHPGVKGITLWGYVEFEVWRPYTHLLTERLSERPAMEWLRTYLAAPFRPVLNSTGDTTSLSPLLSWHPSDSAKTYRIQVSLNSFFNNIVADTTIADTLFQLKGLPEQTKYYWRVNASNDRGTSDNSAVATFITGSAPTGVKNSVSSTLSNFSLEQNYPNPFNPSTTITFSLPLRTEIRLVILNMMGQEIEEIISGRMETGEHRIQINASSLASGMYFYRLQTSAGFVQTKKMLLVK